MIIVIFICQSQTGILVGLNTTSCR